MYIVYYIYIYIYIYIISQCRWKLIHHPHIIKQDMKIKNDNKTEVVLMTTIKSSR